MSHENQDSEGQNRFREQFETTAEVPLNQSVCEMLDDSNVSR